MKEYVVVRICNKLDGTVAVPVSTHETEEAAQKEFFRQCGLAVDSTHLTDAVSLLTKQGFELKHEYFTHTAPEPEPEEPESEPGEGE